MSEEILFIEPEIILTAMITSQKGKPELCLKKTIKEPEKIKILAELILREEYIPAKITVKDKLLFKANLMEKKLI